MHIKTMELKKRVCSNVAAATFEHTLFFRSHVCVQHMWRLSYAYTRVGILALHKTRTQTTHTDTWQREDEFRNMRKKMVSVFSPTWGHGGSRPTLLLAGRAALLEPALLLESDNSRAKNSSLLLVAGRLSPLSLARGSLGTLPPPTSLPRRHRT